MDIHELYNHYLKHPHISTDTRDIKSNSLFFALKGENFNGNAFAKEALNKGASLAIIDEEAYHEDDRFIVVNDVLTCLQHLAHYHRTHLSIPIIGITGTNGKTTTKELIRSVLSQKYKTYATKGNLNNHIGVPLSILALTKDVEIAIIEMGANHLGEIAFLCKIAAPTHGLITNVGKAHLEGFGGFEGVIKTKGELYDWLAQHHGVLFLQRDNPLLVDMASQRHFNRVVTYGFSERNDTFGEAIRSDPFLSLRWQTPQALLQVNTQITGRYNLENVLAAVCIGYFFEVTPHQINQGIERYQPSNNRSQIVETAKNTVICDFYNANVNSMIAALDNISDQKSDQKAIILGDMYELGDASFKEHQQLVSKTLTIKADRYIFVGEAFYKHKINIPAAAFFETTAQASAALKESPIDHALVLLKASRGMVFEKLLDVL